MKKVLVVSVLLIGFSVKSLAIGASSGVETKEIGALNEGVSQYNVSSGGATVVNEGITDYNANSGSSGGNTGN